MPSKANTLPIAGLFSLALAIRACWVFGYNSELVWPDEFRFWAEIVNLITEHTFRWRNKYAHDMPLTAIILAMPAYFGGVSAVKISLIVVSSLTVLAVRYLAKLVYPGSIAGYTAGLTAACYPFLVYYSGLVLSETLFIFFLMLFFIQLLGCAGSFRASALLGLLAGLCHLTRPTLLYFLPVFAGYFLIRTKSISGCLTFLVLFCLTVSPWVIRNYIHFDTLLISTSGSGQVLWEGNNPWNQTGGVADPAWGYNENLPENLNELETDLWKKEQALEYIQENFKQFNVLAFKKLVRFWHLWPNDQQFQSRFYLLVSLLSFGPVLLLALSSTLLLRHRWKLTIILWLFVGYYTLLHAITIGSIRYRLPLEPLLIVLASGSIAAIINKLRTLRKTGR